MAMKKFLTIFTIAFVLALTFLTWGFAFGQDVAVADESISYVYVAPADLKNNEYAGATNVAVKAENGTVLFYLIESFYYPVETKTFDGTTYHFVRIDGISRDVCVEVTKSAEVKTSLPDNATADNMLPGNVLLKEGVTISVDGQAVDTRDGWTVKLIGVNGDNFFVVASKDTVTVSGLAPKESFTSSNVAYHPIDLAERSGMLDTTPDGEISENAGDSANKSLILRIVLIIGIAVPAIIIAIMLFKPGRASAKSNYDRHAMRTRREEEIEYDRDRSYDRERDYSRRAPYDDRDYRDEYDRRDDRYDRRDDRYDRRDDRHDRGYDRRDDRDYRGGYDDRNGRR